MIEYPRTLAAGWTDEDADLVEEHVRAQVSAMAHPDDDPDAHAAEVDVYRVQGGDGTLKVVGTLDAEPVAPYLAPGYDPLAGVSDDLYRAETAAAWRDEQEVRRGTP